MLKTLKKPGNGKKEAKKETKPKNQTKQPQVEKIYDDEEEMTDLVDIDYNQKEQTKPKVVAKKKNESELVEREIDMESIKIPEKKQQKKLLTWVANTVEQVTKTEFKMEEHAHDFDSLTDNHFNEMQKKKHQEKVIEERLTKKPERDTNTGIFFKPLEKTKDQLMMEKADKSDTVITFKKNQPVGSIPSGLHIPSVPKNFTNSNQNAEIKFAPVQKTKQQIMLEEAEKKEQQMLAKQKNSSWIGGGKKTETTEVSETAKPFKASPWAVPLNKVEPSSGGMRFAPLQQTEQDKKMSQAGTRQEQEFVCVSKKDMQERKRKRQERDLQEKNGQQAPRAKE